MLKDKSAEPENYWANTSGNDLVRRLLDRADQTTRDEVERLINGEIVTKTIRQELTYGILREGMHGSDSIVFLPTLLSGGFEGVCVNRRDEYK